MRIDNDVTFLIPTYQRPEYLRRALNSVARQTVLPFETIIADNGVGIEAKKIVDAFQGLIPNLKYIQHGNNIGAFSNWLFLAKESRTKFSKILWDDDWLEVNFLEHLMIIMRDADADGALCGAYGHINDELQIWYQDVENFVSDDWRQIFPYIAYRGLPNSPLAGIQLATDLVEALENFDYPTGAITPNLVVGPDLGINFWCIANGRKLAFVREPLVHMFGDGANMTNRTSNKILFPLYRDTLQALHLYAGGSLDSRAIELLDQMVHRRITIKRLRRFAMKTKGALVRRVARFSSGIIGKDSK